MAERMSTASRMDRARNNAAISRTVNGHLKRKERANRDKRMTELVRKGTFPFTPVILNWIGTKLGKPASYVTAADAQGLVK